MRKKRGREREGKITVENGVRAHGNQCSGKKPKKTILILRIKSKNKYWRAIRSAQTPTSFHNCLHFYFYFYA
jgi:hypothetical protein